MLSYHIINMIDLITGNFLLGIVPKWRNSVNMFLIGNTEIIYPLTDIPLDVKSSQIKMTENFEN